MVDLADEVHFALTKDGLRIALHRHRPASPRRRALPVILCHGIATNKMGVDLDATHSLAFFLKRQGFDVFAISLRGGGLSDRSAPGGATDFSFDTFVNEDAPAALDAVRAITEAKAVSWVGYSLGGMIGYAICAKQRPTVACLVTMGSPGKIDHAQGWLLEWAAAHAWVNEWIPLRALSRLLAPLGGLIRTPVDQLLYDPSNVSRTTIQRLLRYAVEDVNPGLARQLARWLREGGETSEDGKTDYSRAPGAIRLPSLFIAGAGDRIAPSAQVRYAHDTCRSRSRSFVLAGKASGFSHDYCHIGLAMGDDAEREIFPLVSDWLDRHGTAGTRGKSNAKQNKRTAP